MQLSVGCRKGPRVPPFGHLTSTTFLCTSAALAVSEAQDTETVPDTHVPRASFAIASTGLTLTYGQLSPVQVSREPSFSSRWKRIILT